MNEYILKYLEDIRIAITDIESFLVGNRSFSTFENNLMLKHAIERNLEIIGEATNRILKNAPDIQITNARNIVGLRNH